MRDSLGLSHRFEILFDDGSQYLSVAEHFYRRLGRWKGRQRVNGVTGGSNVITSYKELEDLPCLVVLAGEVRAGLSFPRYVYVYVVCAYVCACACVCSACVCMRM